MRNLTWRLGERDLHKQIRLAEGGRASAEAQGVAEEEIDAAIDEATQHVRRNKE